MIIVCTNTQEVLAKTQDLKTFRQEQGNIPSKPALERHEKVLAHATVTIRAIFKKEQPYRRVPANSGGSII